MTRVMTPREQVEFEVACIASKYNCSASIDWKTKQMSIANNAGNKKIALAAFDEIDLLFSTDQQWMMLMVMAEQDLKS